MILIILKKELTSILKSNFYWLMAFILTLVWGLTFSLYFHQYSESSLLAEAITKKYNFHNQVISDYFELIHLFVLIVIPTLVVRLFTDELKSGSLFWLFSFNISSRQILLGKYFAICLVIFKLIFLGLTFPMVTAIFGNFQWGAFLASILGLCLLTSVYVAISIFISSTTQSSALVILLSFIASIFFLVVGSINESMAEGVFKNALREFYIGNRFNEFKLGVVNTNSVFLFISITIFFLFLSYRQLLNQGGKK